MFECRHPPFTLPEPLVIELAAAYSEPHRAYHTAAHITDVLRWFDRVADGPTWQHPAAVFIAILFHDAVYVAGAKDNEAASAALARRAITQHDLPSDADRVAALIELTAQHGKLESATGDDALFLDADMAIVGAEIDVYREYARQIRREYGSVPAPAYRQGRGGFLDSLAHRPRIFFSDYFHQRLDLRARLNVADELAMLRQGALD